MTSPTRVVAVPAYVHPLADPPFWARLAECADRLRFVVVNPHNGPGASPEAAYVEVVTSLHAAGVPMVGYVDTAYGARSTEAVVGDAQRFAKFYGIDSVFLDQVASSLASADQLGAQVTALRASGVRMVVANPGVVPHPAVTKIADVTVVFEGPWAAYERFTTPDWLLDLSAERLCHLVYDGSPAARPRPRHAASGCITDGSGANPWDRLPMALR